jgi:hypothetical protein
MEEAEQPQTAAAAASAAPADDAAQVAVLGSGVLGSTPFERHTDRYGAVHLTVLDSIPGEAAPARTVPVPPDEDLAARILQDLARADARYAAAAAAAREAAARRPDDRVVAFDHAPLGTAGTLVARVIANVSARDWGDEPPELRLPKPGERVVLGSGTLFTERYRDVPVIGVRPDDGREDNWMDRSAISRCTNHLVRLEFEMPEASEAAAAAVARARAAGQDSAPPRSAAQAGQLDFPAESTRAPAGPAAGARPRAAAGNRRSPAAARPARAGRGSRA